MSRPSTPSPASPRQVALEACDLQDHLQLHQPGYVWTPLVENQIPETMKARNMTKEQVINDVLLDAQPTKEFVTSEQVAALMRCILCGDDASPDHRRQPVDRRRLDRRVTAAFYVTRSLIRLCWSQAF